MGRQGEWRERARRHRGRCYATEGEGLRDRRCGCRAAPPPRFAPWPRTAQLKPINAQRLPSGRHILVSHSNSVHLCRPRPVIVPSWNPRTARAAFGAWRCAPRAASLRARRSSPEPASSRSSSGLTRATAAGCASSACPEPFGLRPESEVGARARRGLPAAGPDRAFRPRRSSKAPLCASSPRRRSRWRVRAAGRQGNLRLRDRRGARGLPPCLRLPHNAQHGGGRAHGQDAA